SYHYILWIIINKYCKVYNEKLKTKHLKCLFECKNLNILKVKRKSK
ncbi:hypothetical protein LCGC14_2709990, partial [marine sediment metagenome]